MSSVTPPRDTPAAARRPFVTAFGTRTALTLLAAPAQDEAQKEVRLVTDARTAEQVQRPRVLIVEPDGVLALATLRACLDVGLEPKLCMGPDKDPDQCPGLHGRPCDRSSRIEASLVTIDTGLSRIAAPACMGGRVVLAGERPLLGAPTIGALAPDVTLGYPYEPVKAAELLLQLVREARKGRMWDAIRKSEDAADVTPEPHAPVPLVRSDENRAAPGP